MQRVLGGLACACLCTFALADGEGRQPEAMEILRQVDTAIKAVESVRYRSTTEVSGVAVNFASGSEAAVVMIGWNGGVPTKFYAHVTTTGDDGPVELTGGGDGETYFIVDHSTRKGYEDMDPGVLGSAGRALLGAGMVEFVHDRPFDDELGADVVELLGAESVEGELCDKIRVVYGGGQGESIWYFSQKDRLPRRRTRQFEMPGQGEGGIDVRLRQLELEPELCSALFKLSLPLGYEQIDDFAP